MWKALAVIIVSSDKPRYCILKPSSSSPQSNFLLPWITGEQAEAATITANQLVRRALQLQVETSRRIGSQGWLQSESNAIYGFRKVNYLLRHRWRSSTSPTPIGGRANVSGESDTFRRSTAQSWRLARSLCKWHTIFKSQTVNEARWLFWGIKLWFR